MLISMIRYGFYDTAAIGNADLERWLISDIDKEDYSDVLDQMWDDLIDQNLSFVAIIEDGDKTPMGVALNLDARDEPELRFHSKLEIIFQFVEDIEAPIRLVIYGVIYH